MKSLLSLTDSTAIRAYAYYTHTDDLGGENTYLVIWFNNGRIYEYSGVPDFVFKGLTEAASIGKYYNSSIKGKYDISTMSAA